MGSIRPHHTRNS